MAMGHASNEEVVKTQLLPFLFNVSPPAPASDTLPSVDMHYLATAMAGNRTARPLLWAAIRDGWDTFTAKVTGNPIILDRMINVSLPKFTDLETLQDIENFFAGKSTKGFDRTLETVKDKIRGRAAYRERDATVLREWLTTHGYC